MWKKYCEYWIHTSTDCYQSDHDVNYYISYFTILKSLSNDDDTRPEDNIILRTASIDDDVITECNSDGSQGTSITQTVIGESYKSVFSKLNNINLSVDSCYNDNGSPPRSSGSPPIIIGIPKLAPTTTPEEEVNSPTTATDVYENNLTLGNETNVNNSNLEFVL